MQENLLHCYYKLCTLSAHVTCLAPRLTSSAEAEVHLIPVSGSCPKCGQDLLWGELVRRYHKTMKMATEEECMEPGPAKRRKVRYTLYLHSHRVTYSIRLSSILSGKDSDSIEWQREILYHSPSSLGPPKINYWEQSPTLASWWGVSICVVGMFWYLF